MTIVYIAGVVSAAVIVGILVYLYRETAAIERERGQAAADEQPMAIPEVPAQAQEVEPVEVEPGSDEKDAGTTDQP